MDFSGSEAVAVLCRASVRGGFQWIRGVDKKVQPKSAKVSDILRLFGYTHVAFFQTNFLTNCEVFRMHTRLFRIQARVSKVSVL